MTELRTAWHQYSVAPFEADRRAAQQLPLQYTEPVGDPLPAPDDYPAECEFHEACRKALGLPLDLRCGFHGLRLEDGRPAWMGCPRWRRRDFDAQH